MEIDNCDDAEILQNLKAQSRIDKWPSSIKLMHNLGVMKRRKRYIVVRFHRISEEKGENYYRNMLMLYYPFRDESNDLNNTDGSFFGKYQTVKIQVKNVESLFTKSATEYNNALESEANSDSVDEWNLLGPNTGFQQAEQERHGYVIERDLHEEQSRNIDIEGEDQEQNHSKALYTKEVDKALLTNAEYKKMTSSLNLKQKQFMEHYRHWLRAVCEALHNNDTIPQFNIFLSGPGGVGKSHIIKLVHHETSVLKQKICIFQPNNIIILLTAFTGTAAFEINGMTLHSALGFTTSTKDYVSLSCNKLNTIRLFLSNLLVLIIDEISMVGSDFLYKVHRRLVEIKGCEAPFGGVSILAVGDLFQLPPVCQGQIFDEPSIPLARLEGSMWKSKFFFFELTESMRQRDDLCFSELLGRVRIGTCTSEDYDVLMSRNIEVTDHLADVLHVFCTNKAVDQHNCKMLKDKVSSVFTFQSVDKARVSEAGLINFNFSNLKQNDTGGLRELVEVGAGDRVMLTINVDVADGLVNGVCGTVVGFDSEIVADIKIIFIQFDNPRVGRQSRQNRSSIFPDAVVVERKEVSFSVKRGKPITRYRYQFPLTLAWACTIHKVQGKTLDKIVVSMREGRFMAGQAYVAFSRVKKLQGLYLVGFTKNCIKVNEAAINEMKRLCNDRSIQQLFA